MKYLVFTLCFVGVLISCACQRPNYKEATKIYYNALDTGNYNALKNVLHDSVTLISGDYITPYNHNSFHEFFKWDSIFKSSYKIIALEEKNHVVIATVAQKNKRNAFLKNNPLKYKVEISFANDKITTFRELEYIGVNWNNWNQEKDSLINWIKINYPKLDGFVTDMTMAGAKNYIKAIDVYETYKKVEVE
ncbi:hypothetical protein [Maribacter sp. MAR_2009_72]|uniref:hypothetical protein n=1 Tax=Maribacter sp. MAR_2009_72 TaxID=1250050 RepID=UPI00119A08A2|nr:hypothetical protein [Maribacter sp. MAR_2009_72]TVZ16442.1 hypothetical protein JM81_2703 [Maribacter sp. MAR_2009_72]